MEFSKRAEGVIVSQGSRFGGYTLFVKNGELTFVYNFLGIEPEQKLSCPAPPSGKHVMGVDFAKASVSEQLEVLGTMTLCVDDAAAATSDFRTQSGHYALAGEGLAVGRDSADPVSAEYKSGFAFTGGRINQGDLRHRRRRLHKSRTPTGGDTRPRLKSVGGERDQSVVAAI